jgi:rSAM/selenodomain-associated transferase 2
VRDSVRESVRRSLSDPPRPGNAAAVAPRLDLAIVIPTLDESALVADAVRRARALEGAPEVVVADGGSLDGTPDIAGAAGAMVITAAGGRGPQMNAGARATRAGTLLFLHADCELPRGAVEAIHRVMTHGHGAGLFRVRYASHHPLLRLAGALTRFETPLTSFGEAALFVRRELFEAVGGFPEWPLFEDVEILSRLRRATHVGRAEGEVVASARRFAARGVLRQQAANSVLLALYHLGVSPQRLRRLYPAI